MTRYTCYAQTMPGIEPVAWLEIRAQLAHVRLVETLFAREKNGIVVFEFEDALDKLGTLRCIEDAFLLVQLREGLSRDWKDLRTLTRDIEDPDTRILDKPLGEIERGHVLEKSAMGQQRRALRSGPLTFRVVARKEGIHNYRRLDLEQVVQRAVTKTYSSHLSFKEEEADVELWVNVLGSTLLFGLRLSDRTMRHRRYKTRHVSASLRPSVAAALARLTEPARDDVFLEPMCGAGTVVAERLAIGPLRGLAAGDLSPDMLAAARANVPHSAARTLMRWDATRLPIARGAVTKAAVNLPFGKKIGTKRGLDKLYPAFVVEMERVLAPGGVLVVLTSAYDVLREALRKAPQLTVDRGYSVSVLGEWARVYIIRRS